MVRIAALALFGLIEAGPSLYAGHSGSHCYSGHGGTPLDANDTAIANVTQTVCEGVCDNTTGCAAVTFFGQGRRRKTSSTAYGTGDCYLRSDVDLSLCDVSTTDRNWSTFTYVDPPPLTGLTTYHLFEAKYTGLANKDAGDFKGDASFIFSTFNNFSKGNPEASMEHNIIEMSEVNVTGWGTYEQCNAPGADGMFVCPENQTDYCCTVHGAGGNIPTNHTSTQLPGIEIPAKALNGGSGGFWFSFPKESQGVTWSERTLRRIAGKCLGDAWRSDAGGCSECGDTLDQCVASCIQVALCPDDDVTLLQATWDRVFADPNECPDVPLPTESTLVV